MYSPVSLFAFVSKQHPDLTVFSGSPAVLALDLAQRSLPALRLTELSDPYPLLQPATIARFQGPAVPPRAEDQESDSMTVAVIALVAGMGGVAALRRHP